MTPDDLRKQRLEELLNLACIARGWTRTRLGRSLGRDATNLLADSGNPKLDYLVRLAAVLEWPVGQLVTAIWGPDADAHTAVAVAPGAKPEPSATYEEARAAAYDTMKNGDYNAAIEHTRVMYRTARTDDERAKALANESGYWNLLGRHQMAIESAQQGLAIESLTAARRLQLQTDLALALYKLRNLTLALSLAESIAKQASANLGVDPIIRRWLALALYTQGFCHLHLMIIESDRRQEHAAESFRAFAAAKEEFRAAAEILNEPELLGIAHSCDAGLVELEVESGRTSAEAAMARVYAKLEEAVDFTEMTSYWIESYGWWTLAGASIATRHLQGRPLQQAMAICTNKAIEVADRLDHWFIRERVFTLQYLGHHRLTEGSGLEFDYVVDDEDRARIVALMGRFPNFRELGWRILDTARIVRG